MITHPNAKINIGLCVTGKRPDGFHTIESIFYPIPLNDQLEIKEADSFKFRLAGIEVPGAEGGNLCEQAYRLLRQDFSLPPVEITLQKNIPVGAGLGGGSADAAFTLKMLNDLFHLHLSNGQLEYYAAKLGSDCPFFIRNQPQFVTGRGEIFETVELSLTGLHLLLVKPPVFISTKEAYAGMTPKPPAYNLKALSSLPLAEWRHHVHNHFEAHLSQKYPEVPKIKERLYDAGAAFASMTGSGSAVYGLFQHQPQAAEFADLGRCWHFLFSGFMADKFGL